MPASTPNYGLPYPLGADPINIAADVQALAEAADVDLQDVDVRGVKIYPDAASIPAGLPNGAAMSDAAGQGYHQWSQFGIMEDAITRDGVVNLTTDGSGNTVLPFNPAFQIGKECMVWTWTEWSDVLAFPQGGPMPPDAVFVKVVRVDGTPILNTAFNIRYFGVQVLR